MHPHTTIEAAKNWLRARVDEGERCPVCTQFSKVYRRAIHGTMARSLILAYRTHGFEWFHLATLTKRTGRGGEEGKLRYWGLLEEECETIPDGRSGWWRVTPKGRAFILGQITVPRHARIYDGRLLNLDPTEIVDIRDTLGKKFDYDQLMNGTL